MAVCKGMCAPRIGGIRAGQEDGIRSRRRNEEGRIAPRGARREASRRTAPAGIARGQGQVSAMTFQKTRQSAGSDHQTSVAPK